MMRRTKSRGLVWSLLVCLVLVNGFMAAPSVVHAERHGNHQAGTHSTGLCAWLCVAGQGIEASSVDVESTFSLVERVVPRCDDQYARPCASFIFVRGPPQLLR